METLQSHPHVNQTNPNMIFIAILLVNILGIFAYQTWSESGIFYKSDKPSFTTEELEKQYGLQVSSITLFDHNFDLGNTILISIPNEERQVQPDTPVNVVFGNIFIELIFVQ